MTLFKKTQSGFTLIETLVSLIIISLGILGFALLQIESLKAAKTATERSRAIHFASNMMDQIRTNKTMIDEYSTPLGNSSTLTQPKSCADENSTAATTTPKCQPEEMAAYEIWTWKEAIADPKLGFGSSNPALPQTAKSGITINGRNPADVEILIEWNEKAEVKSYLLKSQIY